MTASRYGARRVTTAAMAVLLYAATGVVLPVLHAETEVLRGAAGMEEGHSESCPRIHSDIVCVMVGSYQLPAETPTPGDRSATDVVVQPRRPAAWIPRFAAIAALFVRGPPSA